MVRTGSWQTLNSSVPTVVWGKKGVNRKWFAGEIIDTAYFDLSSTVASRKPAQPLPRITTRGRALLPADDERCRTPQDDVENESLANARMLFSLCR